MESQVGSDPDKKENKTGVSPTPLTPPAVLPVLAAAAGVGPAPDSPPLEGRPPTILVVDDEPYIRKNLEILLLKKGCRVLTASSGVEALDVALRDTPDVVIMDVVMPVMDGYEACRRLKAEPALRHVPVLLLTSLNDVFNKVKGLDAGADDFISKPFNETELRARVWAFLRTKRLHDQLDESYKRLQELEQMKDSLTHMIMHDLAAPLSAIQMGLETVLEAVEQGTPLKGAHQRMLRTALIGCHRLSDLLRDVLTVNRLEEKKFPLELERCDVPSLVLSCLSLLEPSRLSAKVEMDTHFVQDLPLVLCDAVLIRRVLMNLMSNSLKFTPEGGRITVTVEPVDNTRIRIIVADSGMGIAPENLEKIFDKFFQAEQRNSRRGQGLGLTFCRLAVEAHDGRIWAESEVSKGSRFVVEIPVG